MLYDITYMWNLKKNTNEYIYIYRYRYRYIDIYAKQKRIHRHRKQTGGYQREEVVGRDKLGVWD